MCCLYNFCYTSFHSLHLCNHFSCVTFRSPINSDFFVQQFWISISNFFVPSFPATGVTDSLMLLMYCYFEMNVLVLFPLFIFHERIYFDCHSVVYHFLPKLKLAVHMLTHHFSFANACWISSGLASNWF